MQTKENHPPSLTNFFLSYKLNCKNSYVLNFCSSCVVPVVPCTIKMEASDSYCLLALTEYNVSFLVWLIVAAKLGYMVQMQAILTAVLPARMLSFFSFQCVVCASLNWLLCALPKHIWKMNKSWAKHYHQSHFFAQLVYF